jgi:hypothetical protein
MNLKKRRLRAKLLSFIYEANMPVFTDGTLEITDKEVILNGNGSFRRLCIYFTGSIYIHSNLPHGYSIKMTDNVISISNLLLKNLKNDNIIFTYDGDFEISRVYIITIGGKKIKLNIKDIDRLELINNSKTNLEDDTLILAYEEINTKNGITRRKGIDDDSIKGLYTDKPLADGYTGYYNYHPKENIYMTGKTLTNQSKPIGKSASSFRTNKNKLNLTRVLNKTLKRGAVSDTRAITKPIKTKITQRKKEINTTKGGKY